MARGGGINSIVGEGKGWVGLLFWIGSTGVERMVGVGEGATKALRDVL